MVLRSKIASGSGRQVEASELKGSCGEPEYLAHDIFTAN